MYVPRTVRTKLPRRALLGAGAGHEEAAFEEAPAPPSAAAARPDLTVQQLLAALGALLRELEVVRDEIADLALLVARRQPVVLGDLGSFTKK